MRRLTTCFALALVTATVGSFFMPTVAAGQKPPFSTPSLSSPNMTQTSITIRVCAGLTGAPAGFSINWQTAADYALNGWGLEHFAASFAGNFSGSRFDLEPGECTDVEIGNLDPTEIGVSYGVGSNDPLNCDTSYAFRGFAHGNVDWARSEFTSTSFFSTASCDADGDGDGISDVADNCPTIANADQTDADSDLSGDACDSDDDNDGVADVSDNCPLYANADQDDDDADGLGNACDADDDGDGVLDAGDSCPATDSGAVVNAQGCAIAQLCPCDNAWKGHGAYVSCVVKAADDFSAAGLITQAQKSALVSSAGASTCGSKK